jgi:cation diffusion facilitator family transporter
MRPEAATGNIKQRAACLSVLSNTVLTGLKLGAALVTHSVSILSEALHSGLDLMAALMALFAVRRARQAADADHQFGHGKFESISGMLEGALIMVAVALICWSAVRRIVTGQVHLTQPGLGIVVMAISAVANVFVSSYLFRVARKTDSLALEADAWHLRTDVWTSAGVFVGLAAIAIARLAGYEEAAHLDPLIAIGVAVVILRAAWDIMRQSWDHLVDRSLPPQEMERIGALLREHYPEIAAFHRLRTRKAGAQRYIELHLVVPGGQSVADAHALCDHLEADLTALFPRSEVMIHVEPTPGEPEGSRSEALAEEGGDADHGRG